PITALGRRSAGKRPDRFVERNGGVFRQNNFWAAAERWRAQRWRGPCRDAGISHSAADLIGRSRRFRRQYARRRIAHDAQFGRPDRPIRESCPALWNPGLPKIVDHHGALWFSMRFTPSTAAPRFSSS